MIAANPSPRKSSRTWYLLLIPLFALLAVVEFYPLLYSLYLSLTTAGGGFTLGNYSSMVTDPNFLNSVAVSLLYSVGSTVLAVSLGLFLSFLVTQEVRGRRVFEALYIFPLAMAPIVAGVVWSPSAVWDDIETFVHFILKLPYFDITTPLFFFPVMVLSEAWEWAPLIMLVCLSVMNGTAKEVYEAAKLHGASGWQVFRRIALPAIVRSPVTQFIVVLRLIDAMRAFEIPLAWSQWVGYQNSVGSPVDTLSLYLYKLIFVPSYGFPVGMVSAIAVALLAVTLASAAVMLRLMRTMGGMAVGEERAVAEEGGNTPD